MLDPVSLECSLAPPPHNFSSIFVFLHNRDAFNVPHYTEGAVIKMKHISDLDKIWAKIYQNQDDCFQNQDML